MSNSNILVNNLRTRGDGMENITVNNQYDFKPRTKLCLGDKLIFRPTNNRNCYTRPIEPKGKIFNLVPKYVPKQKKKPTYLTKPKEPKFVPYEPYKAAIEPIVSRKNETRREVKSSRNNVDIQDLVTQMSELATAELKKAKEVALESDELLFTQKQWDNEKQKYETDIKNLRETNTHLENQLKFQAQVNSELKTLLVAAVGEDLETRVQHLTEDKLALARELLKSANHLTSHQEHTEWLSGQCEVWRSKFLASSLMVEELARWKSSLSSKIKEMRESIHWLLEERNRVREMSLKIYNNLSVMNEHINANKPLDPATIAKTKNILDLTAANDKLSEYLEKSILKDLPDPRKHRVFESSIIHTAVETVAREVISNAVVLSERPDICSALMGAASAMGKGQMFLQHPAENATCCAHCRGQVLQI